MKNINIRMIKIMLSIVFSAGIVTTVAVAANPWAGIIAPSKEDPKIQEQTKTQTESPKTNYSFITPSKEEKQQQTLGDKNQTNQQENLSEKSDGQFYKSYDSYQSYYDEKEKVEKSAIFINKEDESVKEFTDFINNGEQFMLDPSIVPITSGEYDVLSNVNLKGESGYPVTTSIKARVVGLIDKIKDAKLSNEEKRAEVDKEIKSLEGMSRALKYKRALSGDIYKQMNLPANYTAQMAADGEDSIKVIDEALEKLKRY